MSEEKGKSLKDYVELAKNKVNELYNTPITKPKNKSKKLNTNNPNAATEFKQLIKYGLQAIIFTTVGFFVLIFLIRLFTIGLTWETFNVLIPTYTLSP